MNKKIIISIIFIMIIVTANLVSYAVNIINYSNHPYSYMTGTNVKLGDNVEYADEDRLYFSRTLCIHPKSYDATGGFEYKLIGILDVNKDIIAPTTVNAQYYSMLWTKSKSITHDGATFTRQYYTHFWDKDGDGKKEIYTQNKNGMDYYAARLAYIGYYAENIDENKQIPLKKWWPSDTVVVFRHDLIDKWPTFCTNLKITDSFFEKFKATYKSLAHIETHYNASAYGDTDYNNKLDEQADFYYNFIVTNDGKFNIKGKKGANYQDGKNTLSDSKKNAIVTSINENYVGPMIYSTPRYKSGTKDMDIEVSVNKKIENKGKIIELETIIADVDGATLDGKNTEVYIKKDGKFEKKNISEISNGTKVYVKVKDKTSDEIKISFKNSFNVYQTRVLSFATTSGQENISISGNKAKYNSYITFKTEENINITINKKIIYINKTEKDTQSANVQIGDTIVFKVVVENNGDTTGKINLIDDLANDPDSKLKLIAVSKDGKDWKKYDNNDWEGITETISGKKSIERYFKFNVKTDATGTIKNTATVSSSESLDEEGNTSKSSSATVTVLDYDYKITKTAEKDEYEYGEIVKFTVTVKNNGNTIIKNINVQDNIPTGLIYSEDNSSLGAWSTTDGVNFVHPSKISKKGSKEDGKDIDYSSFVVAYTIDENFIDSNNSSNKVKIESKTITNTATITAIKNRNNKDILLKVEDANKTASDTITIKGYEYLINKTIYSITSGGVKRTENLTTAEVGDTIKYKIELNNLNDTVLYNVQIQDTLPDGLTYVGYDESENKGEYWSVVQNSENKNVIEIKMLRETVFREGGTKTFYILAEVTKELSNLKETVENSVETVQVKNANGVDLWNVSDKEDITVLGYNATLNKYITKHNGNNLTERNSKSNEDKNNVPVVVKQGDEITYNIVLKNTGTVESTGDTKLYNPQIVDTLPEGIKYVSHSTGWIKQDIKDGEKTKTVYTYNDNNNKTEDTVGIGNTVILEITCEVIMSNMYLFNIENEAVFGTINNINKIDTSKVLHLENNKDYIRLDELDIGGVVWYDGDANGLISVDLSVAEGVSDVTVILHDMDNHTKGECDGKCASMVTGGGIGLDEGRYSFENVQKGRDRDENGNYTSNEYKQYYLEYQYDGVKYQSAKYINKDNLTGDGNYNKQYEIDSNAAEITQKRTDFNKSLETIYYNQAMSQENKKTKDLSYTKKNEISTLDFTENTTISAYSFVTPENGNIEKLWLYTDIKSGTNEYLPKTDYLKYINLGLYKRETTDLNVNTGIESFTETINGQELAYIRGSSLKEGYNSRIYKDDFDYRFTDYKDIKIQEEKSQLSELNIEVKYKTVIKNESKTLYSKVNELTQYYADNLKPIYNTDGSLHKQEMKIDTNNDGVFDLTNKVYEFTTQYIHLNKDGNVVKQGNANFSKEPIYKDLDKGNELTYNKIYLSGFEGEVLAPGESIVVYTEYIVDKDSNRQLKILEKQVDTISEINAYSTYIDSAGKISAGAVDIDSNPGNLCQTNKKDEYTDITNKTLYEDDTKRTGIAFVPETYKRYMSGKVWEDNGATAVDGEKIGNGSFDIGETQIKDIKVELIEIVKTKDGQVKEVNLMNNSDYEKNLGEVRTNDNGDYQISNYKPGLYIVRFTYGDKVENIKYNGQDYKSTIYKLNSENKETTNDNILELTNSNRISDARDDETRRLEVMEYSLEMYNRIAEILKGEDSSDKNVLIEKTKMNADTPTFIARIENVENDVIALDYIKTDGTSQWYKKHITGALSEVYDRDSYSLNNIDFGIIERPESNIELQKYIKQIKLETSAGDLLLLAEYGEDSNLIPEKSKGTENLQQLKNDGDNQGFRYINVDEELLQGAKITITYGFIGINKSEVDHLSKKIYLSDSEIAGLTKEQIEDKIQLLPTQEIIKKTKEAKDNSNNLYNKYFDSKNHYGNYLGNIYYKGELGTNDIIARLKIDNILDYVDNNLVFNPIDNKGTWGSMLSSELINKGYLNEDVYRLVQEDGSTIDIVADINGIEYQTETKNNLAVTLDENNVNPKLSVLLKPGERVETELIVSTILSSENESDDMVYENIAEVIKFTTLTGRRTVSVGAEAQTVGNAKINLVGFVNSDPEGTLGEPDTSITEKVMLTPPTGGELVRTYKFTQMIVWIIISVIVVSIGIIYVPKAIEKIKNRKFIK